MAKRALLIGVSQYPAGLSPLPAAVRDVAAMAQVLRDPELGSFDEVKTFENTDPQQMREEIENFFRQAQRDDLVTFFFSGHGVKDDRGNLFFATPNTCKDDRGNLRRATAVSATFVQETMNDCRARRQVVILDCCFSGAFDPSLQARDDGSIDLERQLGAEGRVVLASSSSTQYSFEQTGAELSLYTRYLVEGISTGAGDSNGDGQVSALELHEYAESRVRETAPGMTPRIITLRDQGFNIVLARARTDPRLQYRKEVDQYAAAGQISSLGRSILDVLKSQLQLSDGEAQAIEAEVLRPFRERSENIARYKARLMAQAAEEYPFSAVTREGMHRLQELLGLRDEDVLPVQEEVDELFRKHSPCSTLAHVSKKDLSECDHSKIRFVKNIRDPSGKWAYSLDHIQSIGGFVENRVFELFWLSTSRGVKSLSKGDLMLLNQHAKITHVVEMLDDEVRENSDGYFRCVQVVWMPEEEDWSKLPHQRDVLGFEPPTIGGGTSYTLQNLNKFREKWSSLEAFQQNLVQILTGSKPILLEALDTGQIQQEPRSELATGQTRNLDLGNGVSLTLVYIPGGTFWMGSKDDDRDANDSEKPRHPVTVPAFWMGETPVTQAQYQAVIGENPSHFKGDDRPVETVNWREADRFCQELSKKVQETISLPSESQWEYACRAGTETRYSFGDDAAQLGNYAWFGDNANDQTHSVKQKKPNSWGLYDMHGNVWEWCLDHWHDSYSEKPAECKQDGSALWLSSDESKSRLLRGGSWNNNARICRSAYRDHYDPDNRNSTYGFRVVCRSSRTR